LQAQFGALWSVHKRRTDDEAIKQVQPSTQIRTGFAQIPTPVIAAPVFATTGSVDEDFEDFGEHAWTMLSHPAWW
jgi:hypothetical protein